MRIVTYNLATNLSRGKIWEHYSNPETWPKWHYGIEWVHFDGPFTTGTWGIMKPAEGAPFRFCITDVIPGESFAVTYYLPNAEMLSTHEIKPAKNGKLAISFKFQMTGPLAPLFAVIMGRKIKEHLPNIMRSFDLYVEQTTTKYKTLRYSQPKRWMQAVVDAT